jgi:Ca2+-binding RTX toxin-like protein
MAEIDIYYSGGIIMDGPNAVPVGSNSIDLDVGSLMSGSVQIYSSTTLSIAGNPGFLNTFTGSGLTYNLSSNNSLTTTGGTITGYTFTENGAVEVNVSGFSTAATNWVSWTATDNNTSMYQTLLGGANTINGGPGSDELRGWGTSDLINGGAGDDTLVGGTGRETLFGGLGNDSIVGGTGFNQVNGNQGDDTIVGHSQVGDWLSGGQGNDMLDASASTGANILNGNLGNDTIIGGSGADSLRGGQGDDVIHAGTGNDWISGDLGNNTIYGGQGIDTFHAAAGHDYVNGWHSGDVVQVATGVTYTVTQVGADVHIVFSNGGEMDLLSVQQQSLQPGWIVSA